MSSPELKGQVALVTGASRGIGRAIAIELGQAGACIAGVAKTPDSVNEMVAAFGEQDLDAEGYALDVTQPDAIAETVALIEENSPIDIRVNNAGITHDGLEARMPDEEWREVIDTNLSAAHFLTKAVLRGMMKRRYGRIIHVSSITGIRGNPGQTNYAAAKAGLIGLAKSQAKEVGSRGITVNVVAPGYVETRMTENLPEAATQTMVEHAPIGRSVTPEEVAYAVRFLASPRAGAITGEVLQIDGGLGM
jgi:3-oxoacyl-[acyl-carrier protein] reductase